jgi:glycosyltransferase involved in cell wall biosynthesis
MIPTFSVIIPTYNRPRHVNGCLRALAQQDYPRQQFEVIVVDDGSPEPLDEVVDPYRSRLTVTLLRQTNAGPAAARNMGASVARGEYLAFTDDDCRPCADWLRRLDTAFVTHAASLIGGRTVNRLSRNYYSATSQLILDVVYAFYNRDPTAARFFASNNIAMPKRMFDAVGGFDSGFFRAASEDREFCDRWRMQGHGMAYHAQAVVQHIHQLTLRTFCEQHFSYGRGALRYHAVRARRGSGRMRDDLPFHAQLLRNLRGPFSRMRPNRAVRVLALLLLWQVLNAAGFVYERLCSLGSPRFRGPELARR